MCRTCPYHRQKITHEIREAVFDCSDICYTAKVYDELQKYFHPLKLTAIPRTLGGYYKVRISASKEEVSSVIAMAKLKYNCSKLHVLIRRVKKNG